MVGLFWDKQRILELGKGEPNMKKAERLIYILNLLMSRQSLEVANLAKLCSVSRRTIYRDMVALSEASVPIYYDDGYKLADNAAMLPVSLSCDEFLTLRTALESSPVLESPLRDRAIRVLTKISKASEDCIPESMLRQPLRCRIMPKITDEITSGMNGVFLKLDSAVRNDRIILLRYSSPGMQTIEYEVNPYFIVFRKHSFYLIGYCFSIREFKPFKLSGIKSVEISRKRFKRDESVTVESILEHSMEIMLGEPVTVKIRFTGSAAQMIASSNHHPREKKKPLHTGDVIYQVRTAGLDEIAVWLRQFGSEAEVIEPDELRDKLAQFYEKAAFSYRL